MSTVWILMRKAMYICFSQCKHTMSASCYILDMCHFYFRFSLIILALYNLQGRSDGVSRLGYFHWKLHICNFIERHWNILFGSSVWVQLMTLNFQRVSLLLFSLPELPHFEVCHSFLLSKFAIFSAFFIWLIDYVFPYTSSAQIMPSVMSSALCFLKPSFWLPYLSAHRITPLHTRIFEPK